MPVMVAPVVMMPVVPVVVMPMMPMAVVPVVMMPMVPVVMAPVVVVVVPADLFGLETINLVLPHNRGLRACSARQYQTLSRRNWR
jgi:hypothetical protein